MYYSVVSFAIQVQQKYSIALFLFLFLFDAKLFTWLVEKLDEREEETMVSVCSA